MCGFEIPFLTPTMSTVATSRHRCRCSRYCGGPSGDGKDLSYSTFRRHQIIQKRSINDPLVVSTHLASSSEILQLTPPDPQAGLGRLAEHTTLQSDHYDNPKDGTDLSMETNDEIGSEEYNVSITYNKFTYRSVPFIKQ